MRPRLQDYLEIHSCLELELATPYLGRVTSKGNSALQVQVRRGGGGSEESTFSSRRRVVENVGCI